MSFFSVEFLILIFIFFIVFNLLGKNKQNALLLGFNILILYLFNPYCLLVVFVFSFFIHFFALSVYVRNSKNIFYTAIFFIVLNLCIFKYYSSIKDSVDYVLSYFDIMIADIIFPLGLSFYTFNAITYIVWVYKEKQEPVGYLTLFTYLSFFATFVSGPIFRYVDFIKQFNTLKRFKHKDLILANLLFALVKVFLILPIVDKYFYAFLNDLNNLSFLGLLNCFYLYSIKLYLDFSAYINLVSAFALMIGFKLPKNFNNPFKARNIQDFWKRWHISLSSFIRDYIYIPLGGNRVNRTSLNIIIAFVISGIWHGNSYNFALWGLAHALGLIFISLFSYRFNKFVASFITFTYVSIVWSFFYFVSFDEVREYFSFFLKFNFIDKREIYIFLVVFVLFIINFYSKNHLALVVNILRHLNIFIKIIVINLVLLIVFIYMPSGIPNFIYAGF
ncbi:MBOAT family O-acyltransferase [Campylobacter sp. 2018MI10]|uniref:MBOAT family O-acyltransferase n=2 Tax=unclassified Campylobacter TaxID=2593542 RepID=UPI001BDB3997|nr:MBOAT family O-acyltransferase [Campylobacter sp. 2018MI10]MBT0885060.1 MBOAT family protein [Campylobacter sp. 2018MI10]